MTFLSLYAKVKIVTICDRKEVSFLSAYGRILVELRGEKSQSEVTKAVGIATSTLGMYETGQRIPRDGIKIALAKYYNTTVQRIFFTDECHEKGHDNLELEKEVV